MMNQPTAAQVELFIAAAKAGLGAKFDEDWVVCCTEILRDTAIDYPQETQIPLFLLKTSEENDFNSKGSL